MSFRKKNLSIGIVTVLLAAMLFSPAWAQGTDEGETHVIITQIDTSQFPSVTVYISVTDDAGEPVGIDPSRLLIQENGVMIQPDQMQGNAAVIDSLTTMLVMDVSGSMYSADKLDTAKDAAKAYVEQMRPGDQTGLMSFNTEIKYTQELTTDVERLKAAIDSLVAENDTAMYDALVEAADVLDPVPGRKAIIVLTDGMDNVSQNDLENVIARIGPSGLSISTVGLGNPEDQSATLAGIDEPALIELANRAGGEYAYANDPAGLTSLYQRYARVMQSEYAISYTSPGELRDGLTRQLTVSLTETNTTTEAAAYNPGGLVPEVGDPASWSVFFTALAVLLALLFVPAVIGRLVSQASSAKLPTRRKQKPRIKFKDKQV
jgi:Ca-activated chloride channel family protein